MTSQSDKSQIVCTINKMWKCLLIVLSKYIVAQNKNCNMWNQTQLQSSHQTSVSDDWKETLCLEKITYSLPRSSLGPLGVSEWRLIFDICAYDTFNTWKWGVSDFRLEAAQDASSPIMKADNGKGYSHHICIKVDICVKCLSLVFSPLPHSKSLSLLIG